MLAANNTADFMTARGRACRDLGASEPLVIGVIEQGPRNMRLMYVHFCLPAPSEFMESVSSLLGLFEKVFCKKVIVEIRHFKIIEKSNYWEKL